MLFGFSLNTVWLLSPLPPHTSSARASSPHPPVTFFPLLVSSNRFAFVSWLCYCSAQSSCGQPGAPPGGRLPAAAPELVPVALPRPVGPPALHGVPRARPGGDPGVRPWALAPLIPRLPPAAPPLLPAVVPHTPQRVGGAAQRRLGRPPAAPPARPLPRPRPGGPRTQGGEGEHTLALHSCSCGGLGGGAFGFGVRYFPPSVKSNSRRLGSAAACLRCSAWL